MYLLSKCLLLNIGTSSSTSTGDDAEATTFTSISTSPVQGSSVKIVNVNAVQILPLPTIL